MKWIIICILSFLLASCSGDDNPSTQNSFFENSKAFDGFLSEADFKKLFPHANHGKSSSIPDAADNLYSYDNMKKGLELSEEFSVFMSEGDDTIKRLELSAILANWAQETTGGWDTAPDGYTSWGLCWYEEVNARSGGECYFNPDNKYQPTRKPAGDTCFFGRGPIQLSHNANYGAFSEFLYGDMLDLLDNPDAILKNGPLAFASGYWFWTTYRGSPNVPDKTCHEVMVEEGAQGFGRVINIVNGGIECNVELRPLDTELGKKIRNRADHFHYFAEYLGVETELPTRPEGERKDDQIWNDYYRAILVGCTE
jgi:basic endochitinase B